MPLKLLTLNIEGDRHIDRVRATLKSHLPDIACLQEVLEEDCSRLAAIGDYQVRFAIRTRMPSAPDHGAKRLRNWGIAVLTRVPILGQTVTYYADDSRIREFQEPNDARRALVTTCLQHEGRQYRVATTHFTWSAHGEISDEQRTDFARLKQVLAAYPDYILCGDFNAPRGKEMFAKFVAELGLTDHLPSTVTATIDERFHRAGALPYVVDTIFATATYDVRDVQLLEGISDHKGILATIEQLAM
jgi:endonuclease/exonuclease/phosphatase family metal-dependent hydrolase